MYVWATEQDEQSKRIIPIPSREGLCADADGERYSDDVPRHSSLKMYHLIQYGATTTCFPKDELCEFAQSVAQELGLKDGPLPSNEAKAKGSEGVEIVVGD